MHSTRLIYGVPPASSSSAMDGIFTHLPERLASEMSFDAVQLEGPRASKRATLWFRSGAKRIFHVRILRKSGRVLIEMGGGDPATVLKGISVCRDHFDAWFGITAKDIRGLDVAAMDRALRA